MRLCSQSADSAQANSCNLLSSNPISSLGGLMPRLISFSSAVLTLFLCLQLTACSSLTQENYDKIKVGMSFQEVENLLGPGPTCDSAMGMKSCTWGTDDKFVKIQFVSQDFRR
jgi:hypothetical protein